MQQWKTYQPILVAADSESVKAWLNPLRTENLQIGTLANSEDQDEIYGMYCLLKSTYIYR